MTSSPLFSRLTTVSSHLTLYKASLVVFSSSSHHVVIVYVTYTYSVHDSVADQSHQQIDSDRVRSILHRRARNLVHLNGGILTRISSTVRLLTCD